MIFFTTAIFQVLAVTCFTARVVLLFIIYPWLLLLLQNEVEQLMRAAKDGDIAKMTDLIKERKIDVNTRGPRDYPWVS